MSDPVLLAALRQLVAAQQNASQAGDTLRPEDMDAFLREETQGKYGLHDLSDINFRNVGRSLVQGLTLNFGDEILGKLPKALGGGQDAEDEMRLREKLYHSQHPVADDAGQIAGMLPTALVPGLDEAGVGASVLRGTAAGAGMGALAGAGAGEDTSSRLSGAAAGGVAGGLLGSLAPAVSGAINYARGARNPATLAGRKIASAIEQSGGPGAVSQSLDKYVAAGRGNDVSLADLSSPLRQAADYAANTSDEAYVPMQKMLERRAAGRNARVLSDLQSEVGNPQADVLAKQYKQATRDFANSQQGYAGIEAANPKFDLSNVAQYMKEAPVAKAWSYARAAGDIKEGDPLDQMMRKILGANPSADPAQVKAAVRAGTFGPDAQKLAQGVPRPVTFADMQQFRRLIKDKATSAFAQGNGELGGAYKDVQSAIQKAMTAAVPGVDAVDARYAQFKDVERALTEGSTDFHAVDTRGIPAKLAGMSSDEARDAYRLGMTSELVASLRNMRDNRNSANELTKMSDAMEDKMKTVFGGNQNLFDQYMQRVGAERDMTQLEGAVGGSQTARRQMAQEGADPTELALLATHGPSGMAMSALRAAAKASKSTNQRAAAAQMMPPLMTQGEAAIRKFLQSTNSLGKPMVSGLANYTLPVMAGRTGQSLMSSF